MCGIVGNRLMMLANQRHPAEGVELLKLVYDELRRQEGAYTRRERPGHTIQATAPVHQACLRLAGVESPGPDRAAFRRHRGQVHATAPGGTRPCTRRARQRVARGWSWRRRECCRRSMKR